MNIDWDQWRGRYDTMSFDDMMAFYDRVYREHPEQEYHHADAVESFLMRAMPTFVTELGGWTGELAAKMLSKFEIIDEWENIEIAEDALYASDVVDIRYKPTLLNKFPWEYNFPVTDAFIAAHVIEHMKFDQFQQMMARVDAHYVYLEAPLLKPGETWDGYDGSHILEVGWPEIESAMSGFGWDVFDSEDRDDIGIRCFYQ